MSELKITQNSLENAILKDGQFVSGNANEGEIDSSGDGAVAIGFVDEGGQIISKGRGTLAIGVADINKGQGEEGETYEFAKIDASGYGSIATGFVQLDSSIQTDEKSCGALANGCATNRGIIIAKGYGSHAEGYASNGKIEASGNGAHAEGTGTIASGDYSHAEGSGTTASNFGAHAEGSGTTATGMFSHAEGGRTKATGNDAHAEGFLTDASAEYSHAEGDRTKALSKGAHAEGVETIADAQYSHAEGRWTQALGIYSHASGNDTIANQEAMTAVGRINKTYDTTDLTTLFVVGDGYYNGQQRIGHNAFTVSTSSNQYGYTGYSTQAMVNGVSDVYLGCPIGTIVMWASRNLPNGWEWCNGKRIDLEYGEPSENQFKVIHNSLIYHSTIGDYKYKQLIYEINGGENEDIKNNWPYEKNFIGSPYIKLPSFSRKFPLGATDGIESNFGPNNYNTGLGSTGGEAGHQLTKDEMPSHNHGIIMTNDPNGTTSVDNAGESGTQTRAYTNTTGNDDPHNNIPPFLAINFIIKYK